MFSTDQFKLDDAEILVDSTLGHFLLKEALMSLDDMTDASSEATDNINSWQALDTTNMCFLSSTDGLCLQA